MLKCERSGAGFGLVQPIENFDLKYANKVVSYSVWMKASLDAAATAYISIGETSHTYDVTADWREYKGSIKVAVGGTYSPKGLQITYEGISDPIGDSVTLNISSPQLVFGDFVGAYQPRLISQELTACQRYYYAEPYYKLADMGSTTSSSEISARFGYPSVLRTVPSEITVNYLAVFGLNSSNNQVGWDVFTSKTITITERYATLTAVGGNVGWAASKPAQVIASIHFDAEIYS